MSSLSSIMAVTSSSTALGVRSFNERAAASAASTIIKIAAILLRGVGPVVFIDTAGLDDEGELGALRVEKSGADEDVDRILGLWEEEKSAEDELKLSAPAAAKDVAAAGPAEVGAGAPADIPVSAGGSETSDEGETSGTEMTGNRRGE